MSGIGSSAADAPAPLADEARIRALVPHADGMCLLHAVVACDAEHIVCHATSHRDPTNPLARDGRLSALHLVEYGAQAMALHGALLAAAGADAGAAAPPAARPGVLAAVRALELFVVEIDDAPSPLVVTATRLGTSPAGSQYTFHAEAGGRRLGAGRVLVMTPE